MSHDVLLSKERYTEAVVRKSLYWLSETCPWQLDDTSDAWVVKLLAAPDALDNAKAELDRLLNDFQLRSELDRATGGLRQQIVSAALASLAAHGTRT